MNEHTARIELRVTQKEKNRITTRAQRYGLSTTEYLRQRALGYEPTAVPPDAFFDFYRRLCELTDRMDGAISPETEQKYLALADEIHSALLGRKKE